MIVVPAGVKVHLALGYTDMRKGLDGLATLIQEHLKKDPFSGHLFVFRGKKASLLKILFWDGTGLCLFTKRIDRGGHGEGTGRRGKHLECRLLPMSNLICDAERQRE
jgi:transposase